MLNIGIVEDEPFSAAFVEEVTKELGHSVVFNTNCDQEAFSTLEQVEVDLVFLDINLKDGLEGIELAKKINNHTQTPIIYITAYKDRDTILEVSKTKPFYFISKPFDVSDLEVALLLFCEKREDTTIVEISGGYRFNTKESLLLDGDTPIKLTQKEKNLLDLLIQNRGFLVSVEQITESVWPDKAISGSALRDTIYRIRKKAPNIQIEAISSLGYKLTP